MPSPTCSASRSRGGCWPTSASPTCFSWRRLRTRTGTASWYSPRCVRRPADALRHRPGGHVVDEVERPLVSAPGGGPRRPRARPTCSAARSGCALQCIPVRYHGRVIAIVTREAPTTSGRRPGELERYYLEAFDRIARMVDRRFVPVRPRRDRARRGATRGRRGDPARRRRSHPVREPELGELAAPHGHPCVHVGRPPRRDRVRRRRGRRRGPGRDAGDRRGRARRTRRSSSG